MSVEVERKFVFSADTLKTLENIGGVRLLRMCVGLTQIINFRILPAVCVGECQFHDQYFDTPSFELTLRDTWLRKRKGCWELKCPTSGVRSLSAELCTHYQEISSLSDIYQRVKEMIRVGEAEAAPSQGDDSWLRELNLTCFAEFTTTRRSFSLVEEGVKVDLDQADFGHHVGEIEVLVPEGGDVRSAREKIKNAAERLGELRDNEHRLEKLYLCVLSINTKC